ncbi:hypothetical protein IQ266_25085 [filamentous cyanobacterium LEGE 11480]|uniref:Uncharacterized protein n=1 Tax=Romeriopsis navalis LEGE 11480 TaxID=2777977 RepID=A0A928VR73_9CYAN|nr:hypothetical protein [Romeriopsis navalis]MBE9033015.1 hypothetical protein [Romeriopsis navalis LEGE 11480]
MREATRERLRSELAEVESQISMLEGQGEYYLAAWISFSKPSGKSQAYPRVQSRFAQFRGKKVLHIRRSEAIADYQERCDRGQRIGKLRKQAARLAVKLE